MRQTLLILLVATISCAFVRVVFFKNGHSQSVCSLDGSRLRPIYEVILISKEQSVKHFSCVLSAQIWFKKNGDQVASVLVTDETTGRKIKSEKAFYVLSDVITTPHTANRIHVFAKRSYARLHAGKFNGKLIKNPFQAHDKEPAVVAKYKAHFPTHDFFLPYSQQLMTIPCNINIITKQTSSEYIYRYSPLLSDGHLNPPDKPPRNTA